VGYELTQFVWDFPRASCYGIEGGGAPINKAPMRRYKEIKELGDGTYGSVSLARAIDNGELVAIKK